MLIGASLLAGCTHLNLAYTALELSTWINSIAFGACLGVVLASYIRASASFLTSSGSSKAWGKLAGVLAGSGISAFLGLVITSVMLHKMEKGVQMVLTVSAACMMGGAALMMWARYARSGKIAVAI